MVVAQNTSTILIKVSLHTIAYFDTMDFNSPVLISHKEASIMKAMVGNKTTFSFKNREW